MKYGSPVLAIIEALSENEGLEPTELEYTLQDYIDGDVLESLMTNSKTDWTFRFRVADHAVTVDSNGTVAVEDAVYQ